MRLLILSGERVGLVGGYSGGVSSTWVLALIVVELAVLAWEALQE